MSRQFQFSLSRLFVVLAAISISAAFAAKLARIDDVQRIEVFLLWMGITVGAALSAGGVLLDKKPLRGAVIGFALGWLFLLPFLVWYLLSELL